MSFCLPGNMSVLKLFGLEQFPIWIPKFTKLCVASKFMPKFVPKNKPPPPSYSVLAGPPPKIGLGPCKVHGSGDHFGIVVYSYQRALFFFSDHVICWEGVVVGNWSRGKGVQPGTFLNASINWMVADTARGLERPGVGLVMYGICWIYRLSRMPVANIGTYTI